MTKVFTFYDEGYYDNPACSCCEGFYMACFNSDDTDCNLGSAHDYETCYAHAIITEIGRDNITEEYEGSLYYMSLGGLKMAAILLDIEVRIIS